MQYDRTAAVGKQVTGKKEGGKKGIDVAGKYMLCKSRKSISRNDQKFGL